MRKYLKKILEEDPAIEVVEMARDGEEAVEKNLALKPDVITLDLNMPKMDGLTALQYIMHTSPCAVVVVSSLTHRGALTTFEALELGAVDCIAKPEGTVSLNLDRVSSEIRIKVKAAARAKLKIMLGRGKAAHPAVVKKTAVSRPAPFDQSLDRVVIIGVSTGGPRTLEGILPALPGSFPAPVIVVQHMPEGFTKCFAERLDAYCALRVREAADGVPLEKGTVTVARGGYHLKFARRPIDKRLVLRLSRDPGDVLYIPSVSVTLRSLRQHLRDSQIVGVMLTGMGDDGVDEMAQVRKGGGYTIAESEETAVVWGMPGELWQRGGADVLAPAYDIAPLIIRAVEGNRNGRP
ncbi:MAG TPA: chemotaxis response regulator protein-glutamate methylesterase [Syntrophomonadaceae bacterium]|nr:chemotaxis response regulator protein-glutamate methylesterase [Syntrophomonadaceae bacterium]